MENQLSKKDYENILYFQSLMQKSKDNFSYQILKNLSDVFGFKRLTIFHVDDEGVFNKPEVFNIDKDMVKIYTEFYFKKDPFYFKNLNDSISDRKAVTVSDILPYDNFIKTDYYNDFFKMNDCYHEAGIYLKLDGRHIGAMGIFRSKDEGHFSKSEIDLMCILSDLISFQLSEYQIKNRLENQRQLYQNSFSNNPIGIFFLDKNSNIIECNSTANEYLHDIAGLKRNYLPFVYETIKDILNNKMNEKNESFLCNTNNGYAFKIVPIVNKETNVNYIGYMAPPSAFSYWQKQNESYDLTKREWEIIELIAKGLTNKQIGEMLYISHQTVKTHIENILAKLQVENRTAILSKIYGIDNER